WDCKQTPYTKLARFEFPKSYEEAISSFDVLNSKSINEHIFMTEVLVRAENVQEALRELSYCYTNRPTKLEAIALATFLKRNLKNLTRTADLTAVGVKACWLLIEYSMLFHVKFEIDTLAAMGTIYTSYIRNINSIRIEIQLAHNYEISLVEALYTDPRII